MRFIVLQTMRIGEHEFSAWEVVEAESLEEARKAADSTVKEYNSEKGILGDVVYSVSDVLPIPGTLALDDLGGRMGYGTSIETAEDSWGRFKKFMREAFPGLVEPPNQHGRA